MRNFNQAGLLPQEKMDQVVIGIIGTGAIGSFVAMALTKMGFKNIITWDPDKIEEHNISNQMFPVSSVGKRKAIATREMVEQFSGEKIVCLATEVGGGNAAINFMAAAHPNKDKILILCVDSLDVRRQIVGSLQTLYGGTIIDARMGAKTYRVMQFDFAVRQAREEYLSTLVPDAEAVQERCGQKSIIYTVLGVAAEVCSFVHQIVMPKQDDRMNVFFPEPVVFDYGTGVRLQKQVITSLVKIEEEIKIEEEVSA